MGAAPLVKVCATRGCGDPTAGPHLSKCAPCLTGMKRINKLMEQERAVLALPPIAVPAGVWAFRVPGLPVAWNNALIRMSGRRPFLSDRAKEWKRSIAIEAGKTCPGGWPLDSRYEMDLHSVFANARADRDGPLKLVQDALTGIAWKDDNCRQVIGGQVTAEVDASAPRIEVIVRLAAQRSLA